MKTLHLILCFILVAFGFLILEEFLTAYSQRLWAQEKIVRTAYQCEKMIYVEIAWRTPCPFGDLEPLRVKLPTSCRFADELKVGDDILRRSNIETNEASRHWRMELLQK